MADNDREIFGQLRIINERTARIDERTKRMDEDAKNHHTDHEQRIHALEIKEAQRGGFIAAISAVGSAIGSVLTLIVNHFIGGN